jgi:probable F420-dependent oxidoreductase
VTPQISIQLVNFSAEDPGGWDHLLDRARAADDAGIDRVVVSDHVVFGEDLDAYGNPKTGGTVGGKQPTGPDGHWLEPLTTLTTVGAITSRVRLGTGILLAALRRPVVLAKTAATIDVLTKGRLDLGVGVGWQREEYDAAGLDFEYRGRLLDHSLEVCQALSRGGGVDYDAAELSFSHIHQAPTPVQPGGVPFWISGTVNQRVVKRLAKFGSGWIPWGPAARDAAAGLVELRHAFEKAGVDMPALQVQGALPIVKDSDGDVDIDRTMEKVPALVDAGITDFRATLTVPRDRGEATDKLGALVAAFRAATGTKTGDK